MLAVTGFAEAARVGRAAGHPGGFPGAPFGKRSASWPSFGRKAPEGQVRSRQGGPWVMSWTVKLRP